MSVFPAVQIATLIPIPIRAELVGAGENKDHKAIDTIRARIMKAYPGLYRFKSVADERKAAEVPA